MNDLIKRLLGGVLYGDARLNNPSGHDPLRMEAADRLTAMKAAGDALAGFVSHEPDCPANNWIRQVPCTCGLTAALKQWKESSDGL